MSNMTQERTVINLYSPHGKEKKKKKLTQYPLVSPVLHMGFTSGGGMAGVG